MLMNQADYLATIQDINRHKVWGNKFIENLSRDLRLEYPEAKGYSVRNLKYMAKLAESYPDKEFVQQVVAQIPWGHNVVIMDKVLTEEERTWYLRACAENGWSRNDILFTVTGSYGLSILVQTDRPFCFQRHMALIKSLYITDYLLWALNSPLIKQACDNVATGTAQKTVGLTSLKNMLIPLPPLAEQHRIVARLEELLPLCDCLKK